MKKDNDGQRACKLIWEKGWTLTYAFTKIGVKRQNLHLYTDRQAFGKETRYRICELLNITEAHFNGRKTVR